VSARRWSRNGCDRGQASKQSSKITRTTIDDKVQSHDSLKQQLVRTSQEEGVVHVAAGMLLRLEERVKVPEGAKPQREHASQTQQTGADRGHQSVRK
jgi:hypothetical protein